mmetsp:Transcript_72524/g.172933  ORF Transcript_72524/g.172933 Transcript_72524/m.172933 type:complete len:515 (+) Transcript_72524:103-1647(+)|eukprot:CAMPEP_0178436586 /NCGR_PEP_ID=MMETSP0689_2-20121128/34518_1 /TAXON_ID=160604 /ORGANISM="Amphidinium massartii, Strain CS-259" /LENGTH=514 /DNA_ID=CAMNT_0020058691 /DNA_START=13 /DNA_END=1557 /DNA_ORIENTATION=+
MSDDEGSGSEGEQSACGKLGNKIIMAVCVAPLLIVLSSYMVGWNEQRAVCDQKAFLQGESEIDKMGIAGCSDAHLHNGKLVMFTCDIDKESLPARSLPGDFSSAQHRGTGYSVDVRMYQCVEKRIEPHKDKHGHKTGPVTYDYSMQWVSSDQGNNFHYSNSAADRQRWIYGCQGVLNPPWPTAYLPSAGTHYEQSIKVGDYTVPGLSSKIGLTYVDPEGFKLPSRWTKMSVGHYTAHTKDFGDKTDVKGTKIGQIKVSFKSNDWRHKTVTVIGQNDNGVVNDWRPPATWLCPATSCSGLGSGRCIKDLEVGRTTQDELFQKYRDQAHTLTIFLRILGFALLWCAFAMCFGPLEALAECVPCIGPCLGDVVEALACIVSCLPATACCLGIGGVVWVAMRPLIGIPLMMFWCLVMGGMGYMGYRHYEKKHGRSSARDPTISADGMQLASFNVEPVAAQPMAVPLAQPVAQPRMVSVAVPDGCGPGDVVMVPVPDGRSMQVAIPEGVAPGGYFNVAY